MENTYSENDALAGEAQRLTTELKKVVEADKDLRASQRNALAFLNSTESIPSKGVFNLATGVGKTRMMAMITQAWLRAHPNEPHTKIVVVVPHNTLISQGHTEFNDYHTYQDAQHQESEQQNNDDYIDDNDYNAYQEDLRQESGQQLDIGRYDMYRKEINHQIIFTTYNSLEALGKTIGSDNVGLLLLDEAHHATSDNRGKTVQSFDKALHYGFTATPWYNAEKSAEKVIGPVIATVSVPDAIREGDLAEVKNVLLASNFEVDLSGVSKSSNGDYDNDALYNAIARAMSSNNSTSGNEDNWTKAHETIANNIAKFYHDYKDEHVGPIQGKKCLINCRSQKEAEIQAKALNKLFNANKGDNKEDNKEGVAKVYTSDNGDPATLEEFTKGKLPVLCQVGKLTEGFDMPELAITINYPTASYVREAQGAARCLRCPRDGSDKLGLVVDIVFRAPDCDNPVIEAHQNQQVLYQDVIGDSVIFKPHSSITSRNVRSLVGNKEPKEPLSLGDFAVVCNVQDLMTITREAKEKAKESVIPSVDHEKLLSSRDLVDSGIFEHQNTAIRYLKKAQTDYEEGQITEPFVVKAKVNGNPCLALYADKLKKFIDRYSLSLSRPSVDHKTLLSRGDLVDRKIFRHKNTATRYLRQAQEDYKERRITEPFVVEAIGDNGQPCLALYADKLEEFKDRYLPSLSRPSVDHEKLLSSGDLVKRKIFRSIDTAIKYLKKAQEDYKERRITELFVVEATGDNGKRCLALRADKLKEFQDRYVPSLSCPSVDHEKLLSSRDLVKKEIFRSQDNALKYLKKAQADYEEGQIKEPFVVEVKRDDTGQPCLALYADKLKEFIGRYLSSLSLPSVDHEKLLSSKDLADRKIFGSSTTAIKYLKKAQEDYEEGTEPFVVEAKGDNGKPCLALDADKLAEFKTYVKTLRQRNKEDQSPTPPIVVGKQGSTGPAATSKTLNQQKQNSQG